MTHLDRLFAEMAKEEDRQLSVSHRRVLVRHRLVQARCPRLSSARTGWAIGAWATICGVTLVAGTLLWRGTVASHLTATLGDSKSPVAEGAWVNAPAMASLPLQFSDGSRVEVTPSSRVRLLELSQRGAQLALDSGRAGVDVVHRDDRRWELRAGPFVVHVTGTKFDLSWTPNDDRFELVMQEGQVELVGCGFGAGRQLVAGQRVLASCHDNRVEISYDRAAVPEPASSVLGSVSESNGSEMDDSPAARAIASPSSGLAVPKQPSATPIKVDWGALAKQGKYAEALEVVERSGFATESARMRLDELALLAETARHARKPAKARQALTLLRQRFPGSRQAGLAAFSIGVLEFDSWGAYSKAAGWFRTYLKEAPSGPLTREARGRLMEALSRSGSAESSRLASAYLRDYPAGPHAALAKRILATP